MCFVSVTRLRIRKWRYLPGFFYFTLRSLLQARRALGNQGTTVRRDARSVYWTITLWTDEKAMRAFRNHGPHLQAMPKLLDWCDEATYVHWSQEGPEVPDAATAYERLVREGIVSKVKHPSPEHAVRNFPTPQV